MSGSDRLNCISKQQVQIWVYFWYVVLHILSWHVFLYLKFYKRKLEHNWILSWWIINLHEHEIEHINSTEKIRVEITIPKAIYWLSLHQIGRFKICIIPIKAFVKLKIYYFCVLYINFTHRRKSYLYSLVWECNKIQF